MRQFFLETDSASKLCVADTVALDREESHHLFTVLRGGRDHELHLTDGRGHRYTARTAGKDGKKALVIIETVKEDLAESQTPHLVLSCAVVKGKRFELVLEKAVEIGVHTIVPILTKHGVIEPRKGRRDRWLAIIKSALKQSGRSWMPELLEPVQLTERLVSLNAGLAVFGAVPGEFTDLDIPADLPKPQVVPWESLLTGSAQNIDGPLELFIGPEGGWSTTEKHLMLEASCAAVSLGPHVMRTETAAITGLAFLQTIRQHYIQNS